jgi:23S rRNA (uracil1939-C5)-methyltransferase
LAFGGRGVGRFGGKAVFVPFSAPGDVVRCRIVRDRKRYSEGEIAGFHVRSSDRRVPPCPVFGECGGCQWQHLHYQSQRYWKERIFFDLLRRSCGVDASCLHPVVPAPQEWGYRTRVQFKCRQTEKGFLMGFFRRESHFVIDVESCPITHPVLNQAMNVFRTWIGGSPWAEKIPQVDLATGDDGRVRAVIHFLGQEPDAFADGVRSVGEEFGFSIFLQSGRKESLRSVAGPEDLFIKIGNPAQELGYGPGGFAQVNLEQNRNLVSEVLRTAALTGDERVLDLFCGMGNFSLPLARAAAAVTGVEENGWSVAKARQNALRNRISNATFHACPAEGAAVALAGGLPFDLVVLDPPRTGAYRVVRDLAVAGPRRILYVSCDPPTLVRDLVPLLHGGYRLTWSRPFDFFPQTYHIESLTLLEKQVGSDSGKDRMRG